jgi:ZIP family zinc transporter
MASTSAMASTSFWYPLFLSTLAGGSTIIGGLLAVARQPDEGSLAFLLGAAIGVMATVSGAELWLRSASEHGFVGITVAVAVGAALFALLDPLLPKPPAIEGEGGGGNSSSSRAASVASPCSSAAVAGAGGAGAGARSNGGGSVAMTSLKPMAAAAALERPPEDEDEEDEDEGRRRQKGATTAGGAGAATTGAADDLESAGGSEDLRERLLQVDGLLGPSSGGAAAAAAGGAGASRPATAGGNNKAPQNNHHHDTCASSAKHRLRHHSPAQLMRLGTLMAVAMTAHNAPEGFAVAFSADTALGPLMTLAIAVHNVPEGVVIAAPIYAASGSRWKAVGAAALSGLSEPVGALVALLVARPLLRSAEESAAWGGEEGGELLPYVLAAVGGVMLAVCALELWPEARACQRDGRMAQGVLAGAVAMAWTLWVGA